MKNILFIVMILFSVSCAHKRVAHSTLDLHYVEPLHQEIRFRFDLSLIHI